MSNLPGSIMIPGNNGNKYSMVWGGYEWETNTGYMAVDVITKEGQNARFFIDIKAVEDAYSTIENNNLGVAVSSVEYFENGKGFGDTPEVTNMYEENGYAVFEFNAFEQVGNKLYLAINSDGEGYVELANGDQDVVISIVQQKADELIINLGYHLPGTQLYITLVPAE